MGSNSGVQWPRVPDHGPFRRVFTLGIVPSNCVIRSMIPTSTASTFSPGTCSDARHRPAFITPSSSSAVVVQSRRGVASG